MQIWFSSDQKSINQSIQISKEILWLQTLPTMDQTNLGGCVFHTSAPGDRQGAQFYSLSRYSHLNMLSHLDDLLCLLIRLGNESHTFSSFESPSFKKKRSNDLACSHLCHHYCMPAKHPLSFPPHPSAPFLGGSAQIHLL